MFECLMCVYIILGVIAGCKVKRFFDKRRNVAVRCSCRTAASVKDIKPYKKRGRKYVLDYYDMRNAHYCVSFFAEFIPRRWFLNQIVEIYYNPNNPMEISVPDDKGLVSDAKLVADAAFAAYFLAGVFIAVIRYAFF